jgi:DNA modification methylase
MLPNCYRCKSSPCKCADGICLLLGDAREVLRCLPEQSVHCCVTSPPYWGLRDYGCDGQIGLEQTPDEYVAQMVAVFREVRRVLRDDATLWLNLGDSYNAYNGNRGTESQYAGRRDVMEPLFPSGNGLSCKTLKQKDLCGIPWRVAFALQADGWYLRQDIIWHKPNPMPESVTDRCTKAHEYIFLLSKSARYYYDGPAIQEPNSEASNQRYKYAFNHLPRAWETDGATPQTGGKTPPGMREDLIDAGRNKRSVWTIATKPYKGAHFATFPPKLIEPCILAGCPQDGVVLDPFIGSGTTAHVARRLSCKAVGVELNETYMRLAADRLRQEVLF